MPCYSPITGFRGRGGRLVFARRDSVGAPLTVSCGGCIGCRLERSRQWATRLMHESRLHQVSSFVTLTYDDAHLPKDMSLDITHFQKFMKKFRHHYGPTRFFHCGEYGEQTLRPHYHALLFGQNFAEDRKRHTVTRNGDALYTSPTLEKIWGKGYAPIGELTFESAAYVARYCVKKHTGELTDDHYTRWSYVDTDTGECHRHIVKPEYATMSRRPGLGQGWYEKYKTDVYPHDNVITRGHKSTVPRYYDTILEREDPEQFKQIKLQRKSQPRRKITWQRLLDIETVKIASIKSLKRNKL